MNSLFLLPTQALPPPRSEAVPPYLEFFSAALFSQQRQGVTFPSSHLSQSHLKICQLTWGHVLRSDTYDHTAKL